MSITVRRATTADSVVLMKYNQAMAWETEHKRLDEQTLARGVAAALADPAKGFYLVAELARVPTASSGTLASSAASLNLVAEAAGEVVGQLMITTEWSDWRNGWFWWIQSVYVPPNARKQGVFGSLFHEAEHLARTAGDVVGLRLYVERDNTNAQRTYESLGMHDAGYRVYEKMTS